MKKLFICAAALAACTLLPASHVQVHAETAYKSAYVCDAESGVSVFSHEEEKRLPIASMCKIMTLLLSFEAVEKGEISYDELVPVSENAAGMGGSQVFLDKGLSYRCDELLKSIAVCSANDSCVAMAERVAGSEGAFVERMNARARELGANNTLFANCTGLPKEPQYSCAKDVATMFRALISHEKYFSYCKVWVEDFAHPDGRTTTITNTNKLIRAYEGCDGGKTGFTNEAGFCLAATAKRGETRLVSVVIGAESSKQRFQTVSKLFNETFSAYESKTLLQAGQTVGAVPVTGSKTKEVEAVSGKKLTAFAKKGEEDGYTLEYQLPEGLRAPVAAGDKIGDAILFLNGVEVARAPLYCKQDAKRYTWWDALQEGARNWN